MIRTSGSLRMLKSRLVHIVYILGTRKANGDISKGDIILLFFSTTTISIIEFLQRKRNDSKKRK